MTLTLTKEQVERLYQGTVKASEKGINESLVIVDSLAFIVNVPNNTVITAMDQTETKKNIHSSREFLIQYRFLVGNGSPSALQ